MARTLTFHRLELITKKGVSAYDFSYGLNVLTGDYATGKSSMFELIKFALGSRSAELMPDIRRNLEAATLEVTVGRARLRMTRTHGSNTVSVTMRSGSNEAWTAAAGGRLPRAAIRLLELLEFPVLRLPRRSGPASEPITFFDLYRYVYLPQADVNSSVAGHANRMLERKRRAVFEIAYGLRDEEIQNLEVKAAELRRTKDELSRSAATVRKFMSDTGTPDLADLDREEASARTALVEADSRLTQARSLGRKAFGEDQGALRNRLGRLRTAAADLEAEYLALEIAVEKKRSLVAQLELDENAEIRTAYAAGSLSGLEFAQCPRCLQSVRERVDIPPHHCLLCGQPQDFGLESDDLEDRLSRLRNQRTEAEDLVAQDERRLQLVMRELVVTRGQLNEAASELEEQAEPHRLLPSLDMTAEAATSRELARARLRGIERDRDLWSKYEDMVAQTTSLQEEIDKCDSDAARLIQTLRENRFRLAEFGTIFDNEVRGLGLVGHQNSGIDEKSYLPVINGDTFDDLSVSGARKTLANVSYYLANLSMALNDSEILMPSAILLDSPRTSLGNTAGDVNAGWRLYYRMHVLALASPDCQLIVADNGLPEIPQNIRRSFLRATNIIELTYEQPLLRDIGHPGRENVETVGSTATTR